MAKNSAVSAGGAVPATGDRVTIQRDGSFEIDTGKLLLSSPQPFGWLYFTQSYEAQREIYEGTPDLLMRLVRNKCHLLYSNSADNVQVMMFLDDQLNVASEVGGGTVVEDGLKRVSGYYRLQGFDSRVTEFGGCPYLVVTLPDENLSVYQTVVGGVPVSATVVYISGISDLFERFMEETVLKELSISLKTADE